MTELKDTKIDIKLKLSALWTSTLFCYIYCDYFELYTPGKLEDMISGEFAFGTINQTILFSLSMIMLIPSLMIFLSLGLPARVSRILNLVFGTLFSLMMALLTYMAGWYFYKMFAAVETLLTVLVVWYAWNWPKENSLVD